MTLADERLKELDNPSLTTDECALLRARVAADLIHKGQYEAAREALGEHWRGVGERPNVEGLDESTAAEVLLQAGALSGWIGASRQVAGAQAAAKDLISKSAALFEKLGQLTGRRSRVVNLRCATGAKALLTRRACSTCGRSMNWPTPNRGRKSY